MFTGIVEELGEVVATERLSDAARLTIRGPQVTSDAKHGDSIAVNGVCLTVVEVIDTDAFTVDVMAETLKHSSIGALTVGSAVNLERAAALNTRLGGHLVQGHVDGTGQVLARTPGQHWEIVRVSLPDQLARYVVHKGSITVDGVSLTVSALGGPSTEPADDGPRNWFEVSLIPTTLALTVLGTAPVGTVVNLETDVVAKYVERLLPYHQEVVKSASVAGMAAPPAPQDSAQQDGVQHQ